MTPTDPLPLSEIEAARKRIEGLALRTPLIRLGVERPDTEIYLKLENLQPIGSFKLRGAGNAMRAADPALLRDGVFTASAGNMAQGVAWVARELGVQSSVVVPDHAPQTKLDAIERLGSKIIKVPFDRWWEVIIEHRFEGIEATFIHPVCDEKVIAGNGTIGLEILDDLPDVDAVVVPYGGGGLIAGIGSALRAVQPNVRLYAAEVDTAAPLWASLEAGRPTSIDYTPSFVDGIGGKSVLDEMWPLVSQLVSTSRVSSLEEVAAAIRLMVERNRVVAEGAGAAPVAAALAGKAGAGKIACVVSGGNLDATKLATILAGDVP